MPDLRTFRGYICLQEKSRWTIIFPDFPDVCIELGKEFLDPTSQVIEKSCTAVMDAIASLIKQGREVPQPQPHIDHDRHIDIQLDVDLLRQIYIGRN